jgi:hypothetical protein
MFYYRIYGLGHERKIQDVVETICSSDEGAVVAAQRLLERFPEVEVWELSRKVATLKRPAIPDLTLAGEVPVPTHWPGNRMAGSATTTQEPAP